MTRVRDFASGKAMKRPARNSQQSKPDVNRLDAESIDALYGLEPVIESGVTAEDSVTSGGVGFYSVQCPYCGESFETRIDATSGSARYIEDCQICCQPIEFSVEVDHEGVLQAVSTVRGD
jgi:Cysteine-rich CPXCG